MKREQQKPGRATGDRYLATAGIGAASVILLIVIGGYVFGWRWTGLATRTFWDWLELLIVPAVLVLGGYLFTRSENRRAQEIATQRAGDDRELANQRARDDRELANRRAETDRQIAEQRRQDDILQAYLDQMGQLLLDRNLRQSEEGDEVRTLARARTLTVLGRLDGNRKSSLVQFLYESALIGGGREEGEPAIRAIVQLSEADLRNAYLGSADLRRACLAGTDLSEAHLPHANLIEADLSEAQLEDAYLLDATLSGADLTSAYLANADLTGANLVHANLSGADLSAAVLLGADLTLAVLRDVEGINNEELEEQAKSLEGATMPNGQKYEDWIKDNEGRRENGENNVPW